MRYLEDLYRLYKEQKENPIPELKDIEIDRNKLKNKFMELQQTLQESTQPKPDLEFGEIYYLISERGIPIFFMINGKLEGSSQNLYSVYKVSDFVDFATEEDFIFELNELPYMVETWNEFYIPLEEIEKAVYIGKLTDEDIDLLLKILDEGIEIPPEKRGLAILEDGNFIQNRFKEDEVEDVKEYKARIFGYFDDLEEKAEIDFLEELLYKSLEEQKDSIEIPNLAYAAEGELFAERKDFKMMKEGNELTVKITNKDLIGKKGKIHIFGKTIEGTIPEVFKIKIPQNLQNVSIEFIADNLKIEV
ncbi:hypothetical protein [Persephonella sp. KM09-Lau-8]|uniref:hypothetical protein n=1 Tax=Persephonella sp. KM09-Lau-8 TaxID=1158345 RepID=UPI00049501DA|nr:hypothetical protein [Persephonella sp. KM09-Lau-8]